MQGLAGVADIVGPDAEVLNGLRLAPLAVALQPRLVGRVLLQPHGRHVGAPIGEVLGQLLPAVDDRIGQEARLAAFGPRGPERGLVVGPGRRQGAERRPPEDPALVVEVHEVPWVAHVVVHLARAAPPVRLTRQLAHVGRNARRPQEFGDLARQGLDAEFADDAVAGVAPRQRLAGRAEAESQRRERKGRTAGRQVATHERPSLGDV